MNHRIARHEFACSAIDSAFRVVGFTGTEAISQPYRFEIELVSDDPEIDFSDVIDQPATLTMYRGDDPSEVDGIITSLQQLHQTGKQSEFRYGYRAILEPRLSRLAFSMQSRVFQNRTVEEIVSQILKDAGVDIEFELNDSYAPREYTTQYKETDLAFVQRLLEFEGIRYSFRHEQGAETIIVSDDPKGASPIEGDAEIAYSHADGLRPSDSLETIRDFVLEQRLVTGMTRVKDYNYRTPEANVFSENELEAKGSTGVHSDYGVHAKDTDAADRLSRIRAEEIESTRVTVTGTGDCLRFRAGQTFSLRDHYRDGLNQSYLLTSVQHTGAQPDTAEASVADEALPNYSNVFSCLPASAPYRPPRVTPEPKLPGVMTAKVESGGGEYAYIDEEGRYRVKMPFDLADAEAGGASKPIRLAQPYTGAGYGMHFPVHADAEMVFACVDGNVDRPLGLSTVPNPAQGSPVTSANKTRNSIITASNNRIEIEDEVGSERIKLYSPHAESVVQLGAPNCPVDGIVTSTQRVVGIHGGKGIYLNAWKDVTDSSWVGTVGSVVVGAAAFITKQAIAHRVGKFDAFSKLQMGMTGAAGISLASAVGGAVGIGDGVAGITQAAPGHIRMIAGNSIQGLALSGVSFLTGATAEITAGLGISLASGTGLNLFAANDTLKALSNKLVVLHSVRDHVMLNAGKDVLATGRGRVAIEASTKDMHLKSENDLMHLESKLLKVSSKSVINLFADGQTKRYGQYGSTPSIYAGGNFIQIRGDERIVATTGGQYLMSAEKYLIENKSLGPQKASIEIAKNGDVTITCKNFVVNGMNIDTSARVRNKIQGTMTDMKAKGKATVDAPMTTL